MAVFSSSPFTFLTAVSRVSSPSSSLTLCSVPPPSSSLSAPRSSARRGRCACVLYSSSANVRNKDSEKIKVFRHSRTFLDARSREELLFGIKKETEAGRLPLTVASGLEELYQNYSNAVLQSGIPNAEEVIMSNIALAFDRMLLDVQDPFDFPPHHKAMREPFDYYVFAQNFIRALVDFRLPLFISTVILYWEPASSLAIMHCKKEPFYFTSFDGYMYAISSHPSIPYSFLCAYL